MIALTPDTLLQSQAEAIFAAAGAEPRVAMRVSSAHVAALLAAEGVGYAVTDPITAAALGGRVATLTIEPIFWLTYGTLTPHGQTPSPAAPPLRGRDGRGTASAVGSCDRRKRSYDLCIGGMTPARASLPADGWMVPMHVARIETHVVVLPMAGGQRNARRTWTRKAFLFCFVTADDGRVGIGEGWTSYASSRALAATIEDDVAPLVEGQEVDALLSGDALNRAVRDACVMSGRYGILAVALSAVEMALHDLAARPPACRSGVIWANDALPFRFTHRAGSTARAQRPRISAVRLRDGSRAGTAP